MISPFPFLAPALSLRSFPPSFLPAPLHKAKEEDRHLTSSFSLYPPPSTSTSTSLHLPSRQSAQLLTQNDSTATRQSPIADYPTYITSPTPTFFPNSHFPIPVRQSDSEPLSVHCASLFETGLRRRHIQFLCRRQLCRIICTYCIASHCTLIYTIYCISLFAAIVHSSNNKFIYLQVPVVDCAPRIASNTVRPSTFFLTI